MDKPVALVTGGGTGIGAACVRALAAEGFRVGITTARAPKRPRPCMKRLRTVFSSRRISRRSKRSTP